MKFIRKLDNFLGNLFAVQKLGFTEVDPWASKSDETMDRGEWEDYRSNERIDNKEPLEAWLNLLANKERRKFFIFNELTKKLDYYSSVLELGAGQGHIGTMLNYSGIKTDLSEWSSNLLYTKIKQLNVRHFELDFNEINIVTLSKYDCVFAVQLDYIFDIENTQKFLKLCAQSDTDVIFVNTQIIGPLNYLNYCFKETYRLNTLKCHGFVKSLGTYRKLGSKAGFSTSIERAKYEDIDSYYFIKFTKNS
jgi:hypothetical protein